MALDSGGQGFGTLQQLAVGQLLFVPVPAVREAVDKGVGDCVRHFFRTLPKQIVEISDNGIGALLRHGLTLHKERVSAGQAIGTR
ncbi:hypothetical protein ACFC1R_26240 [Kitasatospora sp. NPDC056138]|uniref:hypothetical protein n=1 Tax=Kitasatospora sp. NPDC056138 TaxID=3345724 RepID=UPI0035DE61C8